MFSGQVGFEPSAPSQQTQLPPQNVPQRSQNFFCQIDDRLYLRLLKPADAADLFALVEANRAYLKQWLPWLNTTQTLDDTRHFIRQTQARVQDHQGFAAAMIYDGSLVGVAGLNGINWCDRNSSIGYWISEDQQGQGIVTKACRAILNHGFTHLELNRIAILCATGNDRSQAIPKRLGFVHEGTLRESQWLYNHFVNHEVYSMLRRQWLEK